MLDFIDEIIERKQGSTVQTLLFSKEHYSKEESMAWLKSHNYHSAKVDITDKYLRFRQRPPEDFDKESFATVCFAKDSDGECKLMAVIGKLKGEERSADDDIIDDEVIDELLQSGWKLNPTEEENRFILDAPDSLNNSDTIYYSVQEIKYTQSARVVYVLNILDKGFQVSRYIFDKNPLNESYLEGSLDIIRDVDIFDFEGLAPKRHILNDSDDTALVAVLDAGTCEIVDDCLITFQDGQLNGKWSLSKDLSNWVLSKEVV